MSPLGRTDGSYPGALVRGKPFERAVRRDSGEGLSRPLGPVTVPNKSFAAQAAVETFSALCTFVASLSQLASLVVGAPNDLSEEPYDSELVKKGLTEVSAWLRDVNSSKDLTWPALQKRVNALCLGGPEDRSLASAVTCALCWMQSRQKGRAPASTEEVSQSIQALEVAIARYFEGKASTENYLMDAIRTLHQLGSLKEKEAAVTA